ncbi:MAG: DUF599 domain-containing protein [Defluviimonas sp.]|uniref:DUF599 domain-containing protein n=1 Tax=Albidovulum sp. TaxID=1872424 RepID=UPI001D1AE690|nr:DUF599 domain-containing protein [Paracoccaceae bacterium]MCC0064732.1 DUF599 domain-containing protein [Defluviimonas sp.]
MPALFSFGQFGPTDYVALALLVASWLIFGHLVEHPPAGRPSVTVLMAAYRRDWMREFVTRQPRIFDAAIIDSLRQGTSFLASATMIAIGGCVALIDKSERILGLARDLTESVAPEAVWDVKLIVILIFLTNAFLKFVWSHRLFGYCVILMASVPNDPEAAGAYERADQAAEVNIHAARAFNRGLRAVYFSLGALAWLIGALPLILATAVTLGLLWRREFASKSRRVLIGGLRATLPRETAK